MTQKGGAMAPRLSTLCYFLFSESYSFSCCHSFRRLKSTPLKRDLGSIALASSSRSIQDEVSFCAEAYTAKNVGALMDVDGTESRNVREAVGVTANTEPPWTVHLNRLDSPSSVPYLEGVADCKYNWSERTKNDDKNISFHARDNIKYIDDATSSQVVSAREWMEHIEQCDGPIHGIGAYTVLRCDFLPISANCEDSDGNVAFNNAKYPGYDGHDWMLWGTDFHFDRLCASYDSLLQSFYPENNDNLHQLSFGEPIQETKSLIYSFLREAEHELRSKENKAHAIQGSKQTDQLKPTIRTLMVTILWTPPKYGKSVDIDLVEDVISKPFVRGHAMFARAAKLNSSSMHNHDELPLPPPISVCLALPKEPTFNALALLPHRYFQGNTIENIQHSRSSQKQQGAAAKISSWCRIRRPLEDPCRFKIPGSGVEEVILVRKKEKSDPSLNKGGQDYEMPGNIDDDFLKSLEILEGLISNFFVIYKDGTVRTAPVGTVLSGYARHLVVQELFQGISTQSSATASGSSQPIQKLVLDDTRPPTTQDAISGLWSEVFISSAIRLLVPVKEVLIPVKEGNTDDNNNKIRRSTASYNKVDDNNGYKCSRRYAVLWQADCDERESFPGTRALLLAIVRERQEREKHLATKKPQ